MASVEEDEIAGAIAAARFHGCGAADLERASRAPDEWREFSASNAYRLVQR
jgi:hypothetical protein